MLKKNAQIFEGLFTASDLFVVSAAWIASYWVRFISELIPVDKGVPPLGDYLKVLIFVWLVWGFVFRRFGLYRPMRGADRWREVWQVVKANSFSVLLFLSLTYLFREKSVPFSRLTFFIFWVLSSVVTIASRILVRQFLRYMRRHGYNLRYAVIVGSGKLAADVAQRIKAHPEYGVRLLGCLASDGDAHLVSAAESASSEPSRCNGACSAVQNSGPIPFVKIVGTYSDLPALIDGGRVDQVIIALPLSDHDRLESVIASIGDSIVDVKIVPDFHQFIKLGSLVEEFDGLTVMSLASTPLSGLNRVTKRILDFALGLVFLIIAIPLMILTAIIVRLSSRGPVFYSQERVGLDGRVFRIYKFRTMRLDAENSGAKFAVDGDPRVTWIGKWLRKFSLDEMPQLWNVVRGQMSLVGPRPERPVFISEFRQRIPRYMLRHKVQAGMTGWAQVNGWRGNTSIERRIEHDLYYIEHWSLGFDLKILGMTLFHSLRGKNAY